MEKKTVLSLVRAHVEHDEKAFIEKATKLAEELEQDGDWKLALYVLGLIWKDYGFYLRLRSKNDN